MLPDGSQPADWVSVYQAPTRRPCEEQALVLKAMGITHHVTEQPDGCHVRVPAADASRALGELGLYWRENPRRPTAAWPAIPPSRGVPLAVAWIVILTLCHAIQSGSLSGVDWLGAGELVAGRQVAPQRQLVRRAGAAQAPTGLGIEPADAHARGRQKLGGVVQPVRWRRLSLGRGPAHPSPAPRRGGARRGSRSPDLEPPTRGVACRTTPAGSPTGAPPGSRPAPR